MKIGNHLARCLSLQNLSLFKNGPIGFDWGDNVAINFFCVETWKERKLKFSHMTLVAIYKGGFKQIRDQKNGNLGIFFSPNALDTCKSMAIQLQESLFALGINTRRWKRVNCTISNDISTIPWLPDSVEELLKFFF